jgi:hypothetical protein
VPVPKLKIDRAHSLALVAGKSVTVKIPPNAKAITLVLDMPNVSADLDSLAKVIDVFFNGRKA